MKRFWWLTCLIPLVFSCEDAGPDACYAVDITEEECLARGFCHYKRATFLFTNDDGCLLWEAAPVFPGRDLHVGVCVNAREPHQNNIDNGVILSHKVCRQETPNLHLVFDTSETDDTSTLPPKWRGCYNSEGGWLFAPHVQAYFSGLCLPGCGDGILDPGESCDPVGFDLFIGCVEFGEGLEREYLYGEISCDRCQWNLSLCRME